VVRIGKGATKKERNKGMQYGQEYLATHGKPAWTPLTRVPGSGEPPAFKSFFRDFDKEFVPRDESDVYVAKERKLLLGVLLEKQRKAEEKLLGAAGEVSIWRIENLAKVPVAKESHGQFFSGDSYIVLYKYRNGNRDSYVLFFWQGRDSSTDEKAASALLSVEMAAELADLPGSMCRVVQGKEPHQFLALFSGKMVVRRGGVAGSGGFSRGDSAASGQGGVHLFHIRGTSALDTRAVEVAPKAESLNSGDCFVLLTPDAAFEWSVRGGAEAGAEAPEARFGHVAWTALRG